MDGSDRALMLGVPGIAVLAAFALPTLQRSTTAAVDSLSVLFFTLCALTVWVFYGAIATGTPAAAWATVQRLAPGFERHLSLTELALAALATVAWAWLVRWRTRRTRPVIWKSLVLPAGGVALCWMLLMTLWLPLLDYALSNRPLAMRLLHHAAAGDCLAAPGASKSLVAALEFHGGRTVDARTSALTSACPVLLQVLVERGAAAQRSAADAAALRRNGWQEAARERGPTERREVVVVYKRAAAPGAAASASVAPSTR